MEAKRFAKDFPVVCVGGSAGGLDAYTRLLRHLPADMGVAIVIVNHLRSVATHLHEILPRYTEMPVELITERLLIQPNRVFIIPEQRDLHVLDGEFRLKPMMGYLLHSGRPYILWLAPSALAKHFTIDLYGAGPTATACSARRKKSFPRLREFRRLKRNVNSSR